MAAPLITAQGLSKVFYLGLLRRRVEAVAGVDFEVKEGDIFGFLGPNGAGKTTTIKMLTGLISPTRGSAQIFGQPVSSPSSRRNLGFLPENPYVYPYLTPSEFVQMCGRLSGLSRRVAVDRTRRVLDRVGVLYAAERPVRRLSKGMLQRTGLAAALVSDPTLLILDEPMSGLDPVGRKQVKDLILEERKNGRTIFFSTHILSDVEALCDHVTILRKGRIVVHGQLSDLLRSDVQLTDVTLRGASAAFEKECIEAGLVTDRLAERLIVSVEGRNKLERLLADAVTHKLEIVEVLPRHETLEDLFVREAIAEVRAEESSVGDS